MCMQFSEVLKKKRANKIKIQILPSLDVDRLYKNTFPFRWKEQNVSIGMKFSTMCYTKISRTFKLQSTFAHRSNQQKKNIQISQP